MGVEEGRGRDRDRDKERRDLVGLGSSWSALWSWLMLLGVVGTNVVVLYSLTISRDRASLSEVQPNVGIPTSLLTEFDSLKEELRIVRRNLLDTQTDLRISQEQLVNSQKETHKLLKDFSLRTFAQLETSTSLSRSIATTTQERVLSQDEEDSAARRRLLSRELNEYTSVRPLPLGLNPALNSAVIVSSIGHACYNSPDLLEEYMNYTVGGLCPDDWTVAQTLMIAGCEPLPRRRCFSRTPDKLFTPLPFPTSLWGTPPDESILWTHYSCKSFGCLNRRANESKKFVDCANCFDLAGPEQLRWVVGKDRHDFKIQDIVAYKQGALRLGLDIGGGSGSFAARMREFNVTILTSTLNLNGPFNEFIALRGLAPLFLSIAQRLPFFDGTLDIVHSMHVLSHWIPTETLEFLLYDIDRVLRPGGLLWLDHFFSTEEKLLAVYIPMIENLGYDKIRWVTGEKSDRNGLKNHEMYLSAILEKPPRVLEAMQSANA